jgi:hypothetical protein
LKFVDKFLQNCFCSGNSDGINCPVAAGTAITTALTLTIDAPVTGVLAGLLPFLLLIKASLNKRFKQFE